MNKKELPQSLVIHPGKKWRTKVRRHLWNTISSCSSHQWGKEGITPTMIFVEHDLAFRNTIATKTVYIESNPSQGRQWWRWTAHFMRRHCPPRPVLLWGYQGGRAPEVLARLLWFCVEDESGRGLQSRRPLQSLVCWDTILILRK